MSYTLKPMGMGDPDFATKADLANLRTELCDRISNVENSIGRMIGGCTMFLTFIMGLIKFLG